MRFQFSLRTLFAVVSVAAVGSAWVAHEAGIVQERKAVLRWVEQRGGYYSNSTYLEVEEPTFVRRWLGDDVVKIICVRGDLSDDDLKRIQAAFPGSAIIQSPLLPAARAAKAS
jgi:hypothetical protein